MPFITTTDAADDDAIPRKSQVEELIAVASGAAEDAQEAADAAQATADAALPASARAADVNVAGTDIAAALGGKLPLSGGTMDENAIVNLFNGSKWQQSTPNKGIAGTAGFSIICSVGYEYKFALGFLFILSDNSTTVRKVLYAPATPTATDDTTLGFTTDTTWEMADGTQYHCTDVTEGAAVWEVVPAFDPEAPGPFGGTTPDVVNTTGLNVKDSGGNTTASIDGTEGTATFGYYGGLTGLHIDQFGNLTTNNNAEATLYNFNATNSVNIGIGQAGTLNVKDSGGNTTASIDGAAGTASFLGGNLVITNSPYNQIAASNLSLYIDTVFADNGLWINDGVTTLASLDWDGTAQFKSGAITLGKNTGTAAWIDDDGTASFANGQVTIDEWGDVQTGSHITIGGANGFAGFLNVKNDGGTVIASISGNDGSGEFASQAITLGNSIGSGAWIQSDGSAYFAGNLDAYSLYINDYIHAATGAITLGTNTGTAAWINSDGTASFVGVTTPSLNVTGGSGGTTQIDSTGTLTSWSNSGSGQRWLSLDSNNDSVRLYNSFGGYYDPPTITFTSSDGSASFLGGASFGGGAAGINSDGTATFASNNVQIAANADVTILGGTLSASNGLYVGSAASIDYYGNLTFAGALIGGTQSLITAGGAGAVDLTTLTTEVETTGTADVLTLANGTVGQIKVITHTVGAFTSVLTPTTALGFTTITFLASLGQTCTLEYTTAGWVILAVGGLTLPVVA